MVVTLLRALSTSSSSSLCLLLIFFHRALRLMMMMRKNCVKRVRGVIGRPRLEAPFLVSALSHSLSMSRFFGFFGKSWFFLFDFVFACIITRSYGDKFGSRCSVEGIEEAGGASSCMRVVCLWRGGDGGGLIRTRLVNVGSRGWLGGKARRSLLGRQSHTRDPVRRFHISPVVVAVHCYWQYHHHDHRRLRRRLRCRRPSSPPLPQNTQSSAPIFPPNAWGCLSFHSLFSLMVVVYNGDRSASTAFDPPPFFVIPPVN